MGKCLECGGPTGSGGLLVYHHVDCPEVTMWLLRVGEIVARGRLDQFPDSHFVVWGPAYLSTHPWFSCPQMAAGWAREWMESVLNNKNNGG